MPITLLLMFVAFALLLGLVVAVPVGLFLLIRHREGERSQPLARLASGWGLAFEARGALLPPELAGVFPFDRGFSGKRMLFNAMTGELGATRVLLCDYATLTRAGGIMDRSSRYSPHQVAAFRLHDGTQPDLDALRRDVRASAFRSEWAGGWLVVSRAGFVPPAALAGFLEDAARIVALAVPSQGEALGRALEAKAP